MSLKEQVCFHLRIESCLEKHTEAVIRVVIEMSKIYKTLCVLLKGAILL